MAITITREARDAIYDEILTELSGSGDVWAAMQSGDYDARSGLAVDSPTR